MTKINDKTGVKQALSKICVELRSEEHVVLRKVFALTGMKSAFLEAYPSATRRQLYYGLSNNSYNSTMLKNIREFIENNKEDIEGLIGEPLDTPVNGK